MGIKLPCLLKTRFFVAQLPGEEWTHVTLQSTTHRPLAC
jgi:hypothetical protein